MRPLVVALFVNEIPAPVTVILAIEIALLPPIVCEFVLKVCTPPAAVNVPLFVRPFENVGIAVALSVHVPPTFIVTAPVKVFAPVALESVSVPPLLIVVTPVTVVVNPPNVKPPVLIVSVPNNVTAPKILTPPEVLAI